MNCRAGARLVFSKYEEERLSNYCIQMTDMGFELSKEDVMHSAFLVTDNSDLKHHLKMEKQVKVDLRDFC